MSVCMCVATCDIPRVAQVLATFGSKRTVQLIDASEYANESLFQWDHHERRSRRGASSPGGHAAAAGHAIEACSHDSAGGSWCDSCAGPCSLQRCHWGRKHASTQTKAHIFKAAVAELAPSVVHSREATSHISYLVASGSGSGLSASPRSDDEGSNSRNAIRRQLRTDEPASNIGGCSAPKTPCIIEAQVAPVAGSSLVVRVARVAEEDQQ